MLAALAQDRLRLREGELVNERLVHAVEDVVPPADLADVSGIADDPVHRGMTPAGRGCRCAFVSELPRNCARAESLACVEVEHATDDRCLDRVGREHALLVREGVAEGWPAAEPASFLRA